MSSESSELRDFMDKEMIPTKDISLQKILNNLLDATDNLELKTHIFKPKQLSSLMIISDYLKSKELTKSSKLIDDYVNEYYLRYMVSFKRLSRIEVIKAISSFYENESLTNKEK
ncbi:unnamed protein product [marine sediment metagenome]|uniref:Uncharacterized protein n=1 Tax=marine sediment metagenome TaxID=412755 RepID=X1HJJ0_9ZZZZ